MIGSAEVRRVAGRFATGVTVVTTANGGELCGVTVNAFASLSLEPPQVVVCLNKLNRSFACVEAAGAFAVNVLAAGQEGLSRLFASLEEDKFRRVRFRVGPATGAPILEGAHAHLECRLAGRFEPRGTHAILVGEIVAMGEGGGEPLAFYARRYAALAHADR